MDEDKVIETILPDKDADGFHPINAGKLLLGLPALEPCTLSGIMEMFHEYDIDLEGKMPSSSAVRTSSANRLPHDDARERDRYDSPLQNQRHGKKMSGSGYPGFRDGQRTHDRQILHQPRPGHH